MDRPLRIGDTTRRPCTDNTAFVQRILRLLEEAGASWAPRALGIDDEGREVVSWIPGDMATSAQQIDMPCLVAIVRELHDLTASLVAGFECVIHDDLQPRNVVVRDGRPVGLIDWEQARPGQRVEDVAKLCWSFIEPSNDTDPAALGERWRDVVEAYGLEQVDTLVPTVLAQMEACADDIERAAARQSARHQALADRGDHVAIRNMRAWLIVNSEPVRRSIGA